MDRSEFAEQVHDALAHLYDPVYLQTHPLAQHLACEDPRVSGSRAGKALRQRLLDAIVALRPATKRSDISSGWRAYRLVELRYVEALDPAAVQEQLGIGKSQFYRDHARAMDALVSVLTDWRHREVNGGASDLGTNGSVEQPFVQTTFQPKPTGVLQPAVHSESKVRLPHPLTSFIGRRGELSEVCTLLSRVRLLTLTGPGGSGKTRLALEVANSVSSKYPDGVGFVGLAQVSDPATVIPAVAQELGVHEARRGHSQRALSRFLHGKHFLLVLDNCEHILDAGLAVVELLGDCPRLRILVTSREPLSLSGEHLYPVPPFTVPDPEHIISPSDLALNEAVELFAQRASSVRSDFRLTPQNVNAVAEICRRVDGLPLAIELAAARIRLLTPEALLTLMGHRLSLLKGGVRDAPARHQTLRDAIAWSFDLLNANEQVLFRRMGVFAGGCSLAAAQIVCDLSHVPSFGALDGIAGLVSQSLLQPESSESEEREPRFEMLETIREFALEKLELSGEAQVIRQRHAEYFLLEAERAEIDLWQTSNQSAVLDGLEREHANFGEALTWAIENRQTHLGLRLGSALGPFWKLRGYGTQGRSYLDRLLAFQSSFPATVERAKALCRAGTLAHEQEDDEAARRFYKESLASWRKVGDLRGIAHTLVELGHLGDEPGGHLTAHACYEESLDIHRQLGDWRAVATSLDCLAGIARGSGDYAGARARHQESLAYRRRVGDHRGEARSLEQLGTIAREQHDRASARAYYDESLAIRREIGDQRGVAWSLGSLATIAREEGELTFAQALYEQALATWRTLGDRRNMAMVLACLGHIAFDRQDFQAAFDHYAQSLALRRDLGQFSDIDNSLRAIAILFVAQGDYERAVRLTGAVAALQGIHRGQLTRDQDPFDRVLAPCKEALSERTFDVAFVSGSRMTLQHAIAFVLSDPEEGAQSATGSHLLECIER